MEILLDTETPAVLVGRILDSIHNVAFPCRISRSFRICRILGGFCLIFGLFTRFWALSLIVISLVAISGVHWPDDWNSLAELWESYATSRKSDAHGNFRVPLLFIAMLFPLVFKGAGRISIDHFLAKRFSLLR